LNHRVAVSPTPLADADLFTKTVDAQRSRLAARKIVDCYLASYLAEKGYRLGGLAVVLNN
jgi:hypothetical protein